MANRSSLLNTSIRTGDLRVLIAALESDGTEYVEIAEGANRIPVPWLCCFTQADLLPCTVPYTTLAGKESAVDLLIPCTTAALAVKNLAESLSLFERVVGDKTIAFGYWQDAVGKLQNLPLPYLTMDPVEVLFLNDPAAEAEVLEKALGRTDDAVPFLRRLSSFDENHMPYTLEEFISADATMDHQARIDSSAALFGSFSEPKYWLWSRRNPPQAPPERKVPTKPWWKLW